MSLAILESSAYVLADLDIEMKKKLGHTLHETVPVCFHEGKPCHGEKCVFLSFLAVAAPKPM